MTVLVRSRPLPILLAAVLAHSGVLEAQDRAVTGVVLDEDTALPVQGARVVVQLANEIYSEGLTDGEGRFEVTSPGGSTATLQVSAERYERSDPLRLRPNAFGGRSFRIQLVPLDVTGRRRERTYLVGQVTDAESGLGLSGVLLRIGNRESGVLSGRGGRFILKEVPVGAVRLHAELLGYESRTFELEATSATALDVDIELTTRPIELQGLVVNTRPRAAIRKLEPAYQRMIRDIGGTFIDREEIERRPGDVATLLYAVPGVRIRKRVGAYSVSFPGRQCTPSIFVDGLRVFKPGDIASEFLAMSSSDVELIEVYKGAATLPADYNDTYTTCAIGIWTRRGG